MFLGNLRGTRVLAVTVGILFGSRMADFRPFDALWQIFLIISGGGVEGGVQGAATS